jgi:hypothetical protein
MKAPDDRPEIELSVMTAFSAGSASRSALMAGSGPMPQPKQGNPTVSETPAASSFRTSRRELSPHNLSATAMFSISRSILEVLVRAWQVLKHLWAFDCQNGTFMINVPQVAGCNHSQAS